VLPLGSRYLLDAADVQVTVQSALLTSPGQSLASGQGNW